MLAGHLLHILVALLLGGPDLIDVATLSQLGFLLGRLQITPLLIVAITQSVGHIATVSPIPLFLIEVALCFLTLQVVIVSQ